MKIIYFPVPDNKKKLHERFMFYFGVRGLKNKFFEFNPNYGSRKTLDKWKELDLIEYYVRYNNGNRYFKVTLTETGKSLLRFREL